MEWLTGCSNGTANLSPSTTSRPHPASSLGKILVTYTQHTDAVSTLAWSSDGSRIASGGELHDATVRIWEAATGKTLRVYSGHNNRIVTVAWSPDGKYLASSADVSGSDHSEVPAVHIWEAETGKRIFTYTGHSRGNIFDTSGISLGVSRVAWNHDGTRILSVGFDRTAQIWMHSAVNIALFIKRIHHPLMMEAGLRISLVLLRPAPTPQSEYGMPQLARHCLLTLSIQMYLERPGLPMRNSLQQEQNTISFKTWIQLLILSDSPTRAMGIPSFALAGPLPVRILPVPRRGCTSGMLILEKFSFRCPAALPLLAGRPMAHALHR